MLFNGGYAAEVQIYKVMAGDWGKIFSQANFGSWLEIQRAKTGAGLIPNKVKG